LDTVLQQIDDPEYVLTDSELDRIQWELETLLSRTIAHNKKIENDRQSLRLDDSLSGNATGRSEESAKTTTEKDSEEVVADVLVAPNDQSDNMIRFEEPPPVAPESSKAFWTFVEPYMAHVTKNDLDWLKGLVDSYDEPLCAIPPLGEHYSKNWPKQELKNRKQPSSAAGSSRAPTELSMRITPDVVELVHSIDVIRRGKSVSSSSVYRSVLRSLHAKLQNDHENDPERDGDGDGSPQISDVSKEFFTEQDVEKQLCKLGLIVGGERGNADDDTDNDDEILEELNKCDAELAKLREVNKRQLTELLGRCRVDYNRDAITEKLKNLDTSILKLKKQTACPNSRKSGLVAEKKRKMKLLLEKRCKYMTKLQKSTFELKKNLAAAAAAAASDGLAKSSDSESNGREKQRVKNVRKKSKRGCKSDDDDDEVV